MQPQQEVTVATKLATEEKLSKADAVEDDYPDNKERKASVLKALLVKNWLLKKKRKKATCCELLIPTIFILMIIGLKSLTKKEKVPEGWSDGTSSLPYDNFFAISNDFSTLFDHISGTKDHPFAKLFLIHSGEQREIDAINDFINFVETEGIALSGPQSDFQNSTTIIGDGTVEAFEKYATSTNYGDPFTADAPEIAAAIFFEEMDFVNAVFDYTLRLNDTEDGFNFFDVAPTTGDAVDELQRNIVMDNPQIYMFQGFVMLQQLIDSFIISRSLDDYSTFPVGVDPGDSAVQEERQLFQPGNIRALAFPVGEFTVDSFFADVGDLLPLIFIIVYLLPISQIISVIVLEKEVKAREMMRLMGIPDYKIIASWYITYAIFFVLLALIITLLGGSIFPSTSEAAGGFSFILFFIFLGFGMALVAFGFVISTLFQKSFNAIVVGRMLYFMLFFLADSFDDEPPNYAMLIPQVAFAFCIKTIAVFEKQGIGAIGELIDLKVEGFAISRGITWLYLDIFILTIVGLYLNAVVPGEFGGRMPWYFPLTKSFWKDLLRIGGSEALHEQKHKVATQNLDMSPLKGDHFEEPNESMKKQLSSNVGIQIRGITKKFKTPDGEKVAVDKLSLDVYEGQILVLLGHNGAGKTTLLQMLSGSLTASEGEAFIYGNQLRTELKNIRHDLGFCPQHDVLYKELSVYDHLKFYGSVKGLKGKKLQESITHSVQQVGLTEKLHVASQNLSGGMKRKLSLAISLIGGSRVIFVDEPTSGVDTFSRRSMWEVLQNCREGRVIVLTTHFMDEADLLGDRIAIMAEGQLKCVGSSFFLKQLYGAGYRLTFVKKKDCQSGGVSQVIQKFVTGSELTSDIGTELSFYLPLNESEKFAELFAELDERIEAEDLKVSSYGVSVTTMEEVFLKAGQSEDLLEGAKDFGEPTEDVKHEEKLVKADVINEEVNSKARWIQHTSTRQFMALFMKRVHYARRDSFSFVCNTLVPAMVFGVGLAVLTGSNLFEESPSIELNSNEWNKNFDVRGFMPIVERSLSDSVDFGSGRVAQSGNFPDFVLERPFENSTDVPSGIRNLFGQSYTDGKSASCLSNLVCADLPDSTANSILDLGEAFFNPDVVFRLEIDARLGASDFSAVIVQTEELDTNVVRYSYTMLVNTSAAHATPIIANAMNTALLRRSIVEYLDFSDLSQFPGATIVLNASSGDFGAGEGGEKGVIDVQFSFAATAKAPKITTRSHPLPFTSSRKQLFQAIVAFTSALFCVLAFAFIPGPMISYVVMEKEDDVQIKHLQFVSGVGIIPYWAANYAFDLMSFILPFIISLLLILLFKVDSFIDDGALVAVALVFFGYGLAIIPFSYLLGHFYKKHTTALIWIILINCLTGLILMIASFVMDAIESTKDANAALRWVYRLFPGFCLGDSLLQIPLTGLLNDLDGGEKKRFYNKNSAGANIAYLYLESILFFILVIGIEYMKTQPDLKKKLCSKELPTEQMIMDTADMDEDVKAEEERVVADDLLLKDHRANGSDLDAETGIKEDVLRMIHLRKVYGEKVAVKNVTLGIPEGECFGYLGINGAGKTTTMKCLTGDVFPTSGTGYIKGFNVVTDQHRVRQHVGYCSQFSSILGLLTVREHLKLFCNIKQVDDVENTIQTLLRRLSLVPFENKLAKSLSGGNKRKLSVAIAMIGAPAVMLLDEPSTGMDVASRRFMWNVIEKMVSGAYDGKKTSVILTTHSMEECEALCSRVAIMVGGKLRCLGSVQHLKSRFGTGFTIEAKMEYIKSTEIAEAITRAGLQPGSFLVENDVRAACAALGDPSRVAELNNTESVEGFGILRRLRISGSISVESFVEWVLKQQNVERLYKFLAERFTGLEVVEAYDYKLTYRVAKNETTKLSVLFEALETNKEALNIAEYAVSQTTLEQIFNGFAAQQEEEKGRPRGLVGN